jgi:Schlafen, AlbA_2
MSFFDLPAAAINPDALSAFLNERLPEGLNLDYKRELSASVFETIAAMANTYGGIILVGVDEDPSEPTRPLLPAVGVDASVRERLVNQSYTLLQPPFSPDVVPVSLDDGKVVLVIRVDPLRADRPIVLTRGDSHKIPIRLEARNAPADRHRMAELFAEAAGRSTVPAGPGNWAFESGGTYPLDDRSRPALAVRIALEAPVPIDRLDAAVIDTVDRDSLANALEQSPLAAWLSVQTSRLATSWSTGMWEPSDQPYSNRSSMATLQKRSSFDSGADMPFIGQATLALPTGLRLYSGRLALLLDAAYDPDPLPTSPTAERRRRPRLSLEDIYRLLRALVDTALDVAAPAVFPRILGVPVWERLGPVVYLHTPHAPNAPNSSGIGNFLALDSYVGRTPPDLDLLAMTFLAPRFLDVDDLGSRHEIVAQWLTRLLLDMGLERFENDLSGLD